MVFEENNWIEGLIITGTWTNGAWIDGDRILNTNLQHIIHNNVVFIRKLFFLYFKKNYI